MSYISLAKATEIISTALAFGRSNGMNPLSAALVDKGGNLIAFQRGDGAPAGRFELADGKANACIMLGIPTSAIMARAEQQPYFASSLSAAYNGRFVPLAGGVLIIDAEGEIIGAVGVTGDTSENDAMAATKGIEAAGYGAIA